MSRHQLPTPVKPRALRPGDTVAVVATSGPIPDALVEDGIAVLQGWGLRVQRMAATRSGRAYLAGDSDHQRANEFTAAFADPEVAAILCARGGYGAMRILSAIDWQVVRANPKIVCGYSDITALHQAIRRETGLVTFHGPLAARQSEEPALHPWTEAEWRRALFSTEPLGSVTPPADGPVLTTVCPGRATGTLVGGNLTLVAALAGTPWQLDLRDSVLLLEDVHEAPYRIDRMLTQLSLAGMFDGLRGVLFGDSPTCDRPPEDRRHFTLTEILHDRFGPLGVPVLYGFPCGHTPVRATLPLGVQVTLDAGAGAVSADEAACVSC